MFRYLAMGAAVGLVACAGDVAVCGNGIPEPGESCDDGNQVDDDLCADDCTLPGEFAATVIWEPLLGREQPGFSETCGGVRADDIELVVSGAQNFTLRPVCGSGRTPIRGLGAGAFEISGQLFRTDPNTMTRAPITCVVHASFVIVDADVNVDLYFGYADFWDSYTGSYFYRAKWGSADTCAGAEPSVDSVSLRLERAGQPLSARTMDDQPILLDGTTLLMCVDFARILPSSFKEVPWGPAQITLAGSHQGVEEFRESFPTFVGAGLSNPEMTFDVNAPDAALPDAALPDAALPDAALPDAAIPDA